MHELALQFFLTKLSCVKEVCQQDGQTHHVSALLLNWAAMIKFPMRTLHTFIFIS